MLPSATVGLFEGVCHFEPSTGVHEFASYTFETAEMEEDQWSLWNGETPVLSKNEALCGYQSLYVS